MKRWLLLCALAAAVVFPLAAQEKTKDPSKTEAKTEPKTTDPKKTEPSKTEPSKTDGKTEAKSTDKTPPKSAGPEARVEVFGLNNPCGVAVQPGTGHVFISDSGNLRILRYNPKLTPRGPAAFNVEIVGFPKDVYGKGPMYDIGPLGLVFLNEKLLAVGGGGHQDGQELLYIFDVGQKGVEQQADNAKHKLGPIGPTPGKTEKGEGNFYALAYHKPGAIFVTTNGDDTKGWVAKVNLKDNTPDGKIELAIATKEYTGEIDAPVAITMSPDKKLVIGQMGEVKGKGKDSLLLVYDPATNKPLMKAETGLYDIAGLAYNEKTGTLYALDYAWEKPEDGGLFRLEVTGEGANAKVKAEKVAYTIKATDVDKNLPYKGEPGTLDMPTSMAFDADGNLYVTVIGTAKEGAKSKPGRLVRITGLP